MPSGKTANPPHRDARRQPPLTRGSAPTSGSAVTFSPDGQHRSELTAEFGFYPDSLAPGDGPDIRAKIAEHDKWQARTQVSEATAQLQRQDHGLRHHLQGRGRQASGGDG